MKHDLKYPVEIKGNTISSVTIRRAKGRDMVAIGDKMKVVIKYFMSMASASAMTANKPDAKKPEKAATDQPDIDQDDDLEFIDLSKFEAPGSDVYAGMVAICGQLCDLGEDAADLDTEDIQEIVIKVVNSGEHQGRGAARNGVRP